MAELVAVETALPRFVLDQDGTRHLLPALAGGEAAAGRFQGVVRRSGVDRRHFVVPAEELVRLGGAGDRATHYEREVLVAGQAVARRAVESVPGSVADIHGLVSVSCTGYLLPSFDVHLVPALGLDPSVRRVPLTELGCSAGVAALAVAEGLLRPQPTSQTLIVGVELCSLCVQYENPSDSDVIGNVLFGDAAIAAIVSRGSPGLGPEILGSRCVLWPGTADLLGMRMTDRGPRLVLSPELPDVIQQRIGEAVTVFLEMHGTRLEDIAFWAVHPGGPRVLDAVGDALALPPPLLEPSREVLRRCGNVSSATVYFILRALADRPPTAGSLGLVVAFGPGLTCEMALLRAGGWLARKF